MPSLTIPDLTLRGMVLGPAAAPIDLRMLLYKGGALLDRRWGRRHLESGDMGDPITERIPLVQAIHRRWQSALTAKTLSDRSVEAHWVCLREIARFADRSSEPMTVANAQRLYLRWTADFANRSGLSAKTRYSRSKIGAQILSEVIGISAHTLQWKTKIRRPAERGNETAKENLAETAAFIQTLLETVEMLPAGVVRGPLPVLLTYRDGSTHEVHCGTKLKPIDHFKEQAPNSYRKALERRDRLAADITNQKRSMLINLRIEAEMLIFINQTSANPTQALQLHGSEFRYRSSGDYLVMYVWKNRSKQPVDLRIHKGYREHFEAYLKWRSEIFPADLDGLTFPFVYNDGEKATRRTSWDYRDTRRLMEAIDKPFISPKQLRVTVGNFVRRKVSREAGAELLSNSVSTFRQNYEEIHHQRAAGELAIFWADIQAMIKAVGPGVCVDPAPAADANAPEAAPRPDCEGEAGCLFCQKNRDLRSFDHVWNLTSLRHLKLAELNADRTPGGQQNTHPAALTVERISSKLRALTALGGEYAEWVIEAQLRADEGRYHPFYTAVFELLEVPA